MSLRVWLPLNGTLDNQGLSSVTVTNNGATINDNGKIGKCYYFTPNQWIKISLPAEMTTIKNTTIAAWVKSHSTTMALGGISHDGAATLAGITLYSSGWQLSGGGSWKYISGGTIANTQVWHHVTCTIGDDEIITYLDGVKITSSTLTAQAITNTTLTSTDNFIEIGCDHPGGDEYFTGYVNDFRIYNHALSAKEVKELAKGLVLHYKLDKTTGGNANILTNSSGYEGTSNWSGLITVGTDTDNSKYLIAKRTDTSSTSRTFCTHSAITNLVTNWTPGSKFTISGYYKIPSTETYQVGGNMFIRWKYTSSADTYADTGFTTPIDVEKDKWIRFENTYTVPTSYQNGAANFYLSAFAQGLSTIYWKNIKLEEGDKATPWIPNSADAAYAALGYNQAIEYDCSGYGHDGTINGVTNSSITSRYNASTQFQNTTSSYIQWNESPTFLTDCTISFWAKYETLGTSGWLPITGQTGSQYFMATSAGTGAFYHSQVGDTTKTIYEDGIVVTKPSSNNVWHHYVITGLNLSQWTTLYLNHYGTNASWNSIVKFSDFRVYATALSADDVKELYQTAASIDNHGNVHTYELEEV